MYKKAENFAVLKFAVVLKEASDTQEICFGFIMKTQTHRAQKEPFEMSVPMIINIGRVKRQQEPPKAVVVPKLILK